MIPAAPALATAADFRVPLAPSRLWAAVLAACLAAAWFAWPLAAPGWLFAPLPWLAWRLWRAACRVEAIEVRAGARLSVWQDGVREEVALDDGSVALPGLIVLHYRRAGRRAFCVLLADAAPRDALRRLRVFVRWGALAPTLQVSR
ncbi:MAG: hypothetical protein JO171_14145 [Paludibacterium sp.]|uniref:protein YgfX n=1 Tax=Paludibacterium sp. TaxID=1917523 RepID=UPI0025E31536|nr:protein YgfX [Paludibacterium sp.]MBV8048295.1 hypothetical protein [Paludibacterium sp.]MBV8646458.1 hypothetical protein [Paludibacterium sp.]